MKSMLVASQYVQQSCNATGMDVMFDICAIFQGFMSLHIEGGLRGILQDAEGGQGVAESQSQGVSVSLRDRPCDVHIEAQRVAGLRHEERSSRRPCINP